jgi:hypothetical protein
MPVQNRFLDPQFANVDLVGWLPFAGYDLDYHGVSRVFLVETPTGQPVIRLSKRSYQSDLGIMGPAKSGTGGILVSVWLGRPTTSTDPDLQQVSANVMGMWSDGTAGALTLGLDTATPSQTLGDIIWHRFTLSFPAGPIGWAYLMVSDTAGGGLYVTGPTLLRDLDPGFALPLPLWPSAQRRALTAQEHRMLELAYEQQQDRLKNPR